jgi:peptidoglycan/xylan/chitin deacetylase (PgdA/CDA1 family)
MARFVWIKGRNIMEKGSFTLMVCLVLGMGWPGLRAQDNTRDSFAWPEGKKAAVCLTYDDGLDCHLDVAAPALERHGF